MLTALLRSALALSIASTLALATPSGISEATPSRPAPVACVGDCWQPDVKTSWNWVLSATPKAPFRSVQMYDIDGFDASAADVSALHSAGIKAVCYISAGSWERWRPDAKQFPSRLLGKSNGWSGEKWLDVRDVQKPGSKLRAIMAARLDMCAAKGFDGVELDNVDGYTNSTGFRIKAADQLFYNSVLANDAHARGLAVFQKNDNEQIPDLLDYFDGAINEQCNQYTECTTSQNGDDGLDQYVEAGKPVFQAEYTLSTSSFCSKDNAADFNGVRLNLSLNDKRFEPCR